MISRLTWLYCTACVFLLIALAAAAISGNLSAVLADVAALTLCIGNIMNVQRNEELTRTVEWFRNEFTKEGAE